MPQTSRIQIESFVGCHGLGVSSELRVVFLCIEVTRIPCHALAGRSHDKDACAALGVCPESVGNAPQDDESAEIAHRQVDLNSVIGCLSLFRAQDARRKNEQIYIFRWQLGRNATLLGNRGQVGLNKLDAVNIVISRFVPSFVI